MEKSCGASRIHSHVILEALAEEVRGSTLFTTFLPLPCGQRFLGNARNDKERRVCAVLLRSHAPSRMTAHTSSHPVRGKAAPLSSCARQSRRPRNGESASEGSKQKNINPAQKVQGF
jgi:hypothetical protein